MSSGTLAGEPFLIDPESVAYHYDIKSSMSNTVGGKVVQIYGTKVSEIMVTGSFGMGGWQYQQQFLAKVTQQAMSQVGTLSPTGGYSGSAPIRFTYPPRGWDFLVYLLNYTQPGGRMSVMFENEIINPKWTLTMFIYEDKTGALKTATDAALVSYLNRLATGVGWVPNQYNGPNAATPSYAAPAAAGPSSTNAGGSPAHTGGP